jgi:3-methylfumaryl-CoA hydratase
MFSFTFNDSKKTMTTHDTSLDLDLAHLRTWIGKTISHQDTVSAAPIAALAATLDRREPFPNTGDPIPHSGHWLYFLEMAPMSDLTPDGHLKRGGFLPPVPLPRRMWAGGHIEFLQPIRVGDQVTRQSEVVALDAKSGSSGHLVFVKVRHTVSTKSGVAVIEDHDIVYREAAKPGDPAPSGKSAPTEAHWQRQINANEAVLFRYSAITFNTHRIHYDIDYCRDVEGYPGLIVHGPLQTTLLLDLCRRQSTRPVRTLSYRATHPIFHHEQFTVNGNLSADGNTAEVWTANSAGYYAMRGNVTFDK